MRLFLSLLGSWVRTLVFHVPGAPNHKCPCLSPAMDSKAEAKSFSCLYSPTGPCSHKEYLLNCTELHIGSSLEALQVISGVGVG